MAYNTIVLKPTRLSDRPEEARAGGTIRPGHLISLHTDGTVVVHPTAAAATPKWVAVEDKFQGRTIDTTYASGELVFYHICQPGDQMYMLLPAAAAAIVLTDTLTSNGDGTLKKGATTDIRLFKPLEAIDNSAGGTVVRIKVEAL